MPLWEQTQPRGGHNFHEQKLFSLQYMRIDKVIDTLAIFTQGLKEFMLKSASVKPTLGRMYIYLLFRTIFCSNNIQTQQKTDQEGLKCAFFRVVKYHSTCLHRIKF